MTQKDQLPSLPAFNYYPSKEMLQAFEKAFGTSDRKHERAIVKNHIARTDGMNVNDMLDNLERNIERAKTEKEKQQMTALRSRTVSLMDLSVRLYEEFRENPNSLANWFDAMYKAVEKADTSLLIPDTKILRLPIELAQFIRIEYQETNQQDRELFNRIIFDTLKLDEHKTYFIKTGTFSSKFQFHNARCKEPLEMGEYFQVIQNFAMSVGAGNCVDLVVREYIEDVEDNPTIYNGMPLHTEYRAFVDCDKDEVIGIVPYWNPLVMKRALRMQISDQMEQDYNTYLAHEDVLMSRYNRHVHHVERQLKAVLPHLNLKGKWSIDVMQNGEDFYLIDMATMETSALTELL